VFNQDSDWKNIQPHYESKLIKGLVGCPHLKISHNDEFPNESLSSGELGLTTHSDKSQSTKEVIHIIIELIETTFCRWGFKNFGRVMPYISQGYPQKI
jgi:hypothetical protein